MTRIAPLLFLLFVDPTGRESDQKSLEPFAPLVGEWKGTGQVRRGTAQGAWRESGTWTWSLTKDSAALDLQVADGKYLKSLRLTPIDVETKRFAVDAALVDGTTRRFTGTVGARNALALVADEGADGPTRLTLTPLHDSRFLLSIEAPGATPNTYRRLGEVGYTRQGIAFATRSDGPECIVTGGKGTIAVSHEGKTYHVCCTGCRDLFNEDPAGTLAEAKAEGRIRD